MRSEGGEARMTTSLFASKRVLALGLGLVVLAVIACSSSDTLDDSPKPPASPTTSAPVATEESQTGGNTPLAPTETAVPPTLSPTQPPAPTAVPTVKPVVSVPTATAVATATPDPFVTLKLLASGDVDPNRYPSVVPGDGELLERLFPEAPPYAPHSINDIEITVAKNSCADCHQYGLKIGGEIAPLIPVSHFTDAQTGAVSEELDPRRYVCTSCHVAQVTDALPYPD
jgi:nitrate reductase cytochrome c-type subunit